MNKTKIAINGFGRIGRLAARIISNRSDLELVAINDPFLDAEYGAFMLAFDSVHGKFEKQVSSNQNNIIIDEQEVAFYSEMDPANLPWQKHDVDLVLECTGKFTKYDDAHKHIDAGAKKVLISAPGKNMPMYVMGVNHKEYTPDLKIVSNASCTTNCLAPLAKIIHDEFGIEEALMTTVHSMTASQSVVDVASKKNWRIGRAASVNIIPSSTGAAKAVGVVIPELDGKLTGMSFRVPTANVSVVDLTARLKKDATMLDIINAFKKAQEGDMKGVVGVTELPMVSTDFIKDERTCVLDAGASILLNPRFVKLIAWYDNEWGYSAKLVDLAEHITK
jgi:glyceraldehyde 3-phosphate dehydrogenase